jgi:hypothetical protein
MFARGRSQRAYRVYAEDDFLAADDPDTDGVTPDDSFAEAPSYTAAARRGIPGPLGGRAGVVLVALVAMAVSALVAHALRAGLGGGGETSRPATAPAAVATAPADGRAPTRGAVHVRSDALGARAARAATAPNSEASPPRRERAGDVGTRDRAGGAAATANRIDPRAVQVLAADRGADAAGSASAVSTAAPEFGFERGQR